MFYIVKKVGIYNIRTSKTSECVAYVKLFFPSIDSPTILVKIGLIQAP